MNIITGTLPKKNMIYRFFFIIMLGWLLSLAGVAACFASTVVLQWNANTDPTVTGYKVYYQADSSTQPFHGTGATQGAAPIDVHNQTTATISGLDPSHAYYFAVTAYNSAGVESAYSNFVAVPELVAPTVSITSPANSASVSGTVSVTANATDNVGVTKVEFYVNGTLKATDTSTPYVFSWDTSSLAAGSYTLMAKAYDAANNVGQSANVSVAVVKDTTKPTVSVTSPVNNATVNGSVTITASASDNVGVTNVEFYVDGSLLSATNVYPYSVSSNFSSFVSGPHTITAKAYDAAGNVAQSAAITVIVPVSSDIIWRDTSNGTVAAWPMNGLVSSGIQYISSAPLIWSIAGTGDFNGGGSPDILWRNTSTGEVGIWIMNGLTSTGYQTIGTAPLNWKIAGVGDFNGDGKPDILWRNTSTGEIGLWTMNGLANTAFSTIGIVPTAWQIAGVADFNGDGKPDILWRDTTSGAVAIWTMNGTTHTGYVDVGARALNFTISGVRDFNGDGHPDILWRDTTTGALDVWYMNGTTQTGTASIGSAPATWIVGAIF